MAIIYGVLRGRPDRYKREDKASTPHLQIRVLDDSGQPWRIAVNVQSDTGSDVAFWVVDPLAGHPLLASLPGLASGFTSVADNADHALDYVKAPLFDWKLGRMLRRRATPAATTCKTSCRCTSTSARTPAVRSTRSARSSTRTSTSPSTSSSATPRAPWHPRHPPQPRQRRSHAGDNGTFHDGGLILAFPDRYLGLFLGFQTQRIPTDAPGNAAPGARTIGEILDQAPGPDRLRPTPPPAPVLGRRCTSSAPSSIRPARIPAARSWCWGTWRRRRRRSPMAPARQERPDHADQHDDRARAVGARDARRQRGSARQPGWQR